MDRNIAVEKAIEYFNKANIILTEKEKQNIEIADFGLGQLAQTGLELVTYINTERCCAKELILFPMQTCPEHRHPTIGNKPGKEETFRCRYGEVFLYVEGEINCNDVYHPEGKYTVFHEIHLLPGQQYTIFPDTKHWFRAGESGAVVSEFSTRSTDECDIFTDARIVR